MAEQTAQSVTDTSVTTSGNTRTGVTEERPLDTILARMMKNRQESGKGWVFSMTQEKNDDGSLKPIAIEVKESPKLMPQLDERLALAALRAHDVHDTPSFVAYCQKYGDASKSLITYNDQGFTLCIEEMKERGDRETIDYAFINSQDWNDWSGALNGKFDHKTLMRFLLAHEHNITKANILLALGQISVKSTVQCDSDVRDEGENQSFVVKTTNGEDLKRFPKEFIITLPVLDQDTIVDASWVQATIRLQINPSDDVKQLPTFTLLCSTWRAIRQKRLAVEADTVRKELSGFLIVNGTRGHSQVVYSTGATTPTRV